MGSLCVKRHTGLSKISRIWKSSEQLKINNLSIVEINNEKYTIWTTIGDEIKNSEKIAKRKGNQKNKK